MSLRKTHPLILLLYYLFIFGLTMFSTNTWVLLMSLISAIIIGQVLKPRVLKFKKIIVFVLAFFLLLLINLLLYQEGEEVLFDIPYLRVTKESLFYGLNLSFLILAIIFWFDSYNILMTSDKFLYLSGRIMPATSLVLSMGLKYLPILLKQAERIKEAQIALGDSSQGRWSKLKKQFKIYVALLSWSLENSLDTAAAMKARGYGLSKRTSYQIFNFRFQDLLLIVFIVLCTSVAIFGQLKELSILYLIGTGILFVLGIFLEIKEQLKWNYLKSKI
jgi:energy-coupling factor transport system permease protein